MSVHPPESVVIVGGGVMGLMMARELSAAGCRVVLTERGELGREASWAGGGIVSPLYPWRYSPPVTALSQAAQAVYPQLVRALLEETGIDAELEACGMLMLDAEDRRDALVWGVAHGQAMTVLGAEELYRRFPFLSPGYQQGIWMPAIANVRNPRLLRALRASVADRPGVQLREHTTVARLQVEAGHCRGVVLADGEQLEAEAVVVCGGAWTAGLLANEGVSLTVRPVQGQMIQYRLEPGALPCMVMAQGRYLIPRRDGLVLCGSTLEEVGFDKHTTEAALASLRQSAEALWPRLRGQEPMAQWAGLRPASPNGIPFIGAVPGVAGAWVNAGQYRNGLVLAPASARLLADIMCGRAPLVDPAPYALGG